MFSFSCNLIFQMPFKKTKKMKLEHERGSFRTEFRLSVHLFIVLVIEKKRFKKSDPVTLQCCNEVDSNISTRLHPRLNKLYNMKNKKS